MEYRYVLSPHPHFELWAILRAMMWYYHKRLPIDDPICDIIEDEQLSRHTKNPLIALKEALQKCREQA